MEDKEDLGSEASGSDGEEVETPIDLPAGVVDDSHLEESKKLMLNGKVIPESHLLTKEIELKLFNFKFHQLLEMPFHKASLKVKDKMLDPLLVLVRIMSQFGAAQMGNDTKQIKDFIK